MCIISMRHKVIIGMIIEYFDKTIKKIEISKKCNYLKYGYKK